MAAVLARVQQLLAEWPEHPILSQLAAICDRMLAFPATVPLKRALTGVELLLARAQLWQETAAKHVSIQVRGRWRAGGRAGGRALRAGDAGGRCGRGWWQWWQWWQWWRRRACSRGWQAGRLPRCCPQGWQQCGRVGTFHA